MGLSLKRIVGTLGRGASRSFDQVNPIDGGRSWKTRQPSDEMRNRSGFKQSTDIGKGIVQYPVKFGNTVKAGAGGAYGLAKIGTSSILGTDEGYANTLRGVNQSLKKDLSPNAGLFGMGTAFKDAEEARTITPTQLAGRSLNYGTQIGTMVAPIVPIKGLGAVGSRIVNNAVQSGGGSAIAQQVETGSINPAQVLKDTATGTALGEAGNLVGSAARATTRLVSDPVAQTKAINIAGKASIASPMVKSDATVRTLEKRIDKAVRNMSESSGRLKENYRVEARELIRQRNNRIKEFSQVGAVGRDVRPDSFKDAPQVGKTNPLESLKQEADVLGEIRPIRQFAEQYQPKDASDMSALRSFMAATGQLENMGIKVKNYERIVNNFIKRSGYDGQGATKSVSKNADANGGTGTKLQAPDSSRVQPVQTPTKTAPKNTPRASRVADYDRALEQAKTNIINEKWSLDTVKEKFNAGLKDQNLSNRDGYTELDAYIKEKYGSIEEFYNQATQSQPPKSPLESLKQEAKEIKTRTIKTAEGKNEYVAQLGNSTKDRVGRQTGFKATETSPNFKTEGEMNAWIKKNIDTQSQPPKSPPKTEAPKTVKVYIKSKFRDGGGYADVPVIRQEENITLYQGTNAGENRQFWTPNKKYAGQFGEVREKTGTFYQIDNGNRMTDVYVEAPAKSKSPLTVEKPKVTFSNDEKARMMLDYVKGKPAVEGSSLSGEGSFAPKSLDPAKKAELMAKMRAGSKSTDLPENAKPKVSVKESSIDSTDPFGNRGIIKKLRNELGSLVDDDAPMIAMLKKIEKETGRKGLVDQWYYDTGNIKSSNSIANAKLRQSGDLQEAFGGLNKSGIKSYDDYASARAELKNYEGLPTSKTKTDLEQAVAKGDAEFGGRYSAQVNYYKKMAQDMYDGGLIGKDKLDSYLSSDDYIRIQRDMEDLLPSNFGSSQSRSLGSTKATQKRTGSKRDILSPSETTAKRTQEIQLEIQRNKAANSTIDLLEEQGIATRVPDAKNKNVIKRMKDGKVEYYEVHPDIKKVMDNVNPFQLGILAKIVSSPVRVLRAGATALSAPFTVTNYLRDQASSAIYSKSVIDTHNPQNIVRGLASATRDAFGESQHPLWKKFEMYAGDQTIFDELRNVKNTKNVIREIRRGQTGKAYNAVKSPIRTLEDLNSITEKATRFQNFKGIYEKTLKATGNENEAIKAAVLAARQNSVDFQRSSSFTRTMNLFIPYFNAGVQGSRNVARSFRERPVATSMKSLSFVALPAVAATMYNYSDTERRKVYESIDEYEKEDNFIIVGPNPSQRPDGTWEGVYKIPKPQGYRELTDPIRDITEAFAKNEPVEDVAGMFADMVSGLTGTTDTTSIRGFAGSVTPQQVKPAVQAYANTDLYTGNKIVPEYMQAATEDPAKQAYKNTSGMARMIAEQIGVSPIKVEKFFADTAGSLGRYGVNAVDNALNKAGKIPEEQIGGRSVKEDFSRRLFEASGDLLEENKTAGRKYYEAVDKAKDSVGLNTVETDAYNTLHPSKTDFLGQELFDENKRISKYIKAGIYLQHPKTYEVDKAVDAEQRKQGQPGNPLYDLQGTQLNKVLLKQALPPGASDPELDNLWKEEWYQDYKNATTKFYDSLKAKMAKEGKTLSSDSTYPTTPPDLQTTMDAYSALPKGTGARSNWIKANPEAWSAMTAQWQAVDDWENKERGTIGLDPITDESSTAYGSGNGYGYGNSGSGGSKTGSQDAYKYALSTASGGDAAPRVGYRVANKNRPSITYKNPTKPKVTMKKSRV